MDTQHGQWLRSRVRAFKLFRAFRVQYFSPFVSVFLLRCSTSSSMSTIRNRTFQWRPHDCPRPAMFVLFALCFGREGMCGWGNHEQQTYTLDNHRVADGVLTITVRIYHQLLGGIAGCSTSYRPGPYRRKMIIWISIYLLFFKRSLLVKGRCC